MGGATVQAYDLAYLSNKTARHGGAHDEEQ
jgi:hypothetical protein